MRLGGIDLLRQVLAIAVIWQHSKSHSRFTPDVNHAIDQISAYCEGAVMGFFIISGFFAKSCSGKSWAHVRDVIEDHAKRLLIPYLIFSLVYAFALAALGKADFRLSLFDTITLRGGSMQLYFLPWLFFVVAGYFLFSKAISRPWVYTLGFILLFALTQFFISPGSTGSDWRLLPLYALSFALGRFFKQSKKAEDKPFSWPAVLMLIGLLLYGYRDARFFNLFLAAALFLCAWKVSYLGWLYGRSFPGSGGVYLLHTPLVNFTISSGLLILGVAGYMNFAITVLLTYAACLVVTLGANYMFPSFKHFWLE